MYQVGLTRKGQSGRAPVIEFYTVPIRGPDDYQCRRKIISFAQAEQISRDLAIGSTTGEVDQWIWRVGEFPVCPFCDRPVDEGIPLCPSCESISGETAREPPTGKIWQLDNTYVRLHLTSPTALVPVGLPTAISIASHRRITLGYPCRFLEGSESCKRQPQP